MFTLSPANSQKEIDGTVSFLTDLPDKVLRIIFRKLPYQDVFRCHQLCRSLRSFLKTNMHIFDRPDLTELRFEIAKIMATRRQLRLYFRCFTFIDSHACLKHKEYSFEEDCSNTIQKMPADWLEALETILRSVVARGIITFDNVFIDEDFCRCVMTCSSESTSFCFTNCVFAVSSENIKLLLKSSECTKLDIDTCRFDNGTIDDEVLKGMKVCERLWISNCIPAEFNGITYVILRHWEIQEKLPKEIYLEGIATKITTHDVVRFIKAYCTRYGNWLNSLGDFANMPHIEWNFGHIVDSHGCFEELTSIPGVKWEENDGKHEISISFESLHNIIGASVPLVRFTTNLLL